MGNKTHTTIYMYLILPFILQMCIKPSYLYCKYLLNPLLNTANVLINTRFGMRSVIAEAHFDGSRNSVVELAGMRRWILTHPNQVDWSKPDTIKFPNYAKVKGNEVILTPGDFLYIPTYWSKSLSPVPPL
ncbi:hypothetical protein B484DRAFT_447673 [Ochromonadaceae sp. CCMP2298]|nr:hypothetical protein B484DRAFT_447673 [Ochromonadaceae sp. CCMP2298]